MSEQIYPFAVSKIRTKELNLLTKSELNNLSDEKNADRIKSILVDKDYNFEIIDKIEDFEMVLKNELSKLYRLIEELIPESEFANIFLRKNDYQNIKLILKSNIINKDCSQGLLENGTINKDELAKAVEGENYGYMLSEYMVQGIKKIKTIQDYQKKPYIIDCILDAKSYEEMKKIAEKTKCEFIINYITKSIDLTNIKTFFRIFKTFNKDKELFKMAFIEGGSISKECYLESLNQDLQSSKLRYEGYQEIYDEAFFHPTTFDKTVDNYLMQYMKKAKLKALTIEPIVAYIYAKETEIKNIRIVLTGILNNIEADIIKERLRDSYV